MNSKLFFYQFFVVVIAIGEMMGCVGASVRTKVKSFDETKQVKNLPFEARNYGSNQFKPRVLLLMAMENDGLVPKDWRFKTEKEFLKQIDQTGSYVILSPKELEMNENELKERDKWDWEKINKFAREKSIPLVMEWELLPIQIEQESDSIGVMREQKRKIIVQFKAKMIETRKGKELISEVGQSQREDKDIIWLSKGDKKVTLADYDSVLLDTLLKESITMTIPSLVAQASRVSWSGRVAMIKGDRVYLNVGRQSGLQVGDILKVLDMGDEVFDPETGESIGKVPGKMKGTLEVINYFGMDGAIAVVHSGAGFQENDSIELY